MKRRCWKKPTYREFVFHKIEPDNPGGAWIDPGWYVVEVLHDWKKEAS